VPPGEEVDTGYSPRWPRTRSESDNGCKLFLYLDTAGLYGWETWRHDLSGTNGENREQIRLQEINLPWLQWPCTRPTRRTMVIANWGGRSVNGSKRTVNAVQLTDAWMARNSTARRRNCEEEWRDYTSPMGNCGWPGACNARTLKWALIPWVSGGRTARP